MKRFTSKIEVWFLITLLTISGAAGVFAQPSEDKATGTAPAVRPLLQDIKVVSSDASAAAANTPLVKKTSSVASANSAAVGMAAATLADVEIPGYSGVLVQTMDGKTVIDSGSVGAFNPASNVKIATAYAVLKTFGPEYRFATTVYTDGSFDRESGTLYGNLYVTGRDPVFGYEHAVSIANSLNRVGIKTISGDLIVTDNFAMNYSGASERAAASLLASLDASKRPAAATRAWGSYLVNSGRYGKIVGTPSVTVNGASFVQGMPTNVTLVFTHESAPLREIVKATLCYSNNFLAERLGDMVGGPYAVSRVVVQNTGVKPNEFILASSSGLGINRVTPIAMMKLLRTLRGELERNKMTFADIMPVAGVDKGTLENRFDTDFSTGSVVGKTGTLGNTDGGVSSLAGEINTRKGKLLFVIFNQRGNVSRFRSFQNYYVSLIQGQFGGAAPMAYSPVALDVRLARSKVVYPAAENATSARND